MSENNPDVEEVPVSTRLWQAIQEVQGIRRNKDLDRRKERMLKNAVVELDEVRMAFKEDENHD